MFFLLLALLSLTVGKTSQLAQPKGFTDDPYVDDEKFIEKGGPGLTVSDTFNISQGLKYQIKKVNYQTKITPCHMKSKFLALRDKTWIPSLVLEL